MGSKNFWCCIIFVVSFQFDEGFLKIFSQFVKFWHYSKNSLMWPQKIQILSSEKYPRSTLPLNCKYVVLRKKIKTHSIYFSSESQWGQKLSDAALDLLCHFNLTSCFFRYFQTLSNFDISKNSLMWPQTAQILSMCHAVSNMRSSQ